jgi:hypothetical protein
MTQEEKIMTQEEKDMKYKNMKQEEKAQEIGKQWYFDTMNPNEAAYRASIQMAKWKEQQMIDKAIKWLNDWFKFTDPSGRCEIPITKTAIEAFFNEFRNYMKE